MVVWGFGVGVWGLWCGAFWVFWGWGSLYKHRRITLGIKLCVHPTAKVKSMTLGHMHILISRGFCLVNSVWYVKPFKQIMLFKKATIKNCSECTGRARIVRQEGHRSSNVIDQVCWNDPNPVCFYWFPKYFPLFCLTKQLNNASSISLCNDRARIVRQGGQRSHNIIDQICCYDSNPFCFYWFPKYFPLPYSLAYRRMSL